MVEVSEKAQKLADDEAWDLLMDYIAELEAEIELSSKQGLPWLAELLKQAEE